jgi:hypothetical protein
MLPATSRCVPSAMWHWNAACDVATLVFTCFVLRQFVVYDRMACYPEYLVEYEREWLPAARPK